MNEFIKKHEKDIIGVLSGWDRIRFRGTIRHWAVACLLSVWMRDHGVLIKDFKSFALGLTARLKTSVEQIAAAGGRTITYLASSALSKEDLVRELIRREGTQEGLVCVLSCVEPCQSYEIYRNRETKKIEVASRRRKCLHWYLYFLDSVLGLCHVRIQSWLPFNVHVCVNGREYLCRTLEQANIGFARRDNCLIDVQEIEAAQEMLDAQPWTDWSGMLDGLLERSCPALTRPPFREGRLSYYWSADETEWATDVMFRSPAKLAALYPSLIRHAIQTFSSPDVMRFLGRTKMPQAGGVYARFNGQVVSDLRARPEGVRIKHRMNHNSVKMYDKQGSVLRVETTINDARDLYVHRATEADPEGPKKLRRLRKGVADLPRRGQISQSANRRYLAALGAVDAATPLGRVADQVSQPVIRENRRFRGLNPLSGDDARLVEILLRGEFAFNGFRNQHVRELLFDSTTCPHEQRRQSGKVSRLLRLFREHKLIRKVKDTHRYHLTANGRRVLPAFIAARNANTQKLSTIAA